MTNGPVETEFRYWVVGVPPGQTDKYFTMVRDSWASRGYQPEPGATPRWAPFTTPDGYALVVQNAGKGDGSLSITAGSPCFPKTGEDTERKRQPTELHRPA